MIHLVETTESTNQLALDAARDGAEHGATWVADAQTAGRGRREVGGARRSWFSPAGRNIYMSVLLRPHAPASDISGVTLAVGAHVCGALHQSTNLEALWLKWPNDVFVGNRKMAGILTEGVTGANGVEAVVVGMGLNVNVGADEVPVGLKDILTSIRIETGMPTDRLRLAFALRHAILAGAAEYLGGGWGAVADDITRWDDSRGRTVEVEIDGEWKVGEALGIGDSGQFVARVDAETHEFRTGEVRFRS